MNTLLRTAFLIFIAGGLLHAAETPWQYYTGKNSSIPGDTISALTLDATGRLWLATSSGIGIYANGQWEKYTPDNEYFEDREIRGFALSHDGKTIWAAALGLSKISDGKATVHYDTTMLPYAYVTSVAADSGNNVWAGMYYAGIVKFDGTKGTLYTGPKGIFKTANVTRLTATKDGKIFALLSGTGIAMFDGNEWTMLDSSITGFQLLIPMDISTGPEGDLWIATLHGLARRSADGTWRLMLPGETGLPGYVIYSATADRTGKVWIGTGLASYDGANFRDYTELSAWLSSNQRYLRSIIVGADGTVYGAVFPEGLLVYNPSQTTAREEEPLNGNTELVIRDERMILRKAGEGKLKLEICSAIGERVYSAEADYPAGETPINLNTGRLAAGLYLVSLSEGGNRTTKKVYLH